jgi:3-hydroxy-9,10-secoandrosta-1,3,5(10)-triene-9,17-dione monooxygenase reductase component
MTVPETPPPAAPPPAAPPVRAAAQCAPVMAARFRQVLGHFCTGVTVITTMDAEGPAGFACQAFTALSLDPPLVLFCPSRASATWQRIARSGHFCANVLTESQRELARIFGNPGADKFTGVAWSPSASGAPILDGVLTWVGCTVLDMHEAGDHYVVIGSVTELGPCRPGEPLLFYRGRYGVPGPAEGPPEAVDTLLAWPIYADWI